MVKLPVKGDRNQDVIARGWFGFILDVAKFGIFCDSFGRSSIDPFDDLKLFA